MSRFLFISVEWPFLFMKCVWRLVPDYCVPWTWGTEGYGPSFLYGWESYSLWIPKYDIYLSSHFNFDMSSRLAVLGEAWYLNHCMWIWWGSLFLAQLYAICRYPKAPWFYCEKRYFFHLILGYLEQIIGEGITWTCTEKSWESKNLYWRLEVGISSLLIYFAMDSRICIF